MKECFKCKKYYPLSKFYKHSRMKDGHLNKCIDCTRNDVAENRGRNIEKWRKYDRDRGNRQDPGYCKEYRARYPIKYKAHRVVSYAVSVGKLLRGPCEVCGSVEKVHAHHDDYLKPLDVRWLCSLHHRQWHVKNGPGGNAF